MVKSDPVREALGIVRIGKEMLHSAVAVLLEGLAGFKFLPRQGQQTVAVDFKDFLNGYSLLLDLKAFSGPRAEP